MKTTATLLLAAAAVVTNAAVVASTPGAGAGGDVATQEAFAQWRHYHDISVQSGEDVKMFNKFKQSLREVRAHTEQSPPPSYAKGLTQFAGKAPKFGYKYSPSAVALASPPPPVQGGLPDSVDWRDHGAVSTVKNQGDGSTCWSFSTAGSIEGASVIQAKNKLLSLSNQYLINCIHKGQDTCSTESDTMTQAFDFIKTAGGGMYTYDSYAYVDGACVFWDPAHGCHQNASHVPAPNINVTGYVHTIVGDEDSLKQAAALGPVAVAIDANPLSLYTGGVFDGKCGNTAADLNHAVLVVGYGTDAGEDYWLVKNSWGATWGEKGFFRLLRGKNLCGIAVDASYPILANTTGAL